MLSLRNSKVIATISLLLVLSVGSLFAQESDSAQERLTQEEFLWGGKPRYTITGELPLRETRIKPLTAAVVGGVYIGGLTALHIYQMNTIWQDGASFRIIEDGDYALYADKAGHILGSHFVCYLSKEALLGSGFSDEASTIWGAAMGLAYMTYVEVMDGFGENWGFSPSDMYANIAGVSFFLAQEYVPFLQNFSLKMDFYPPHWTGNRRRPEASAFIDEYSSFTWWLTFYPHAFLPADVQSFLPDWLGISYGFAARNLGYPDQSNRHIIGLDYDLDRLLPEGGTFWNWIRQTLRYVKLPAPAIEFNTAGPPRFHLLYPFRINIGGVGL